MGIVGQTLIFASIMAAQRVAAMYQPVQGRWLSRDPVGQEIGGVNLHAFAQNNPAGAVDRIGLTVWSKDQIKCEDVGGSWDAAAKKCCCPDKTEIDPNNESCGKCGVESFNVFWASGEAVHNDVWALFHLDIEIVFKDDDEHCPACCEFRQNAGWSYHVLLGPNAGRLSYRDLVDDGYSRVDDTDGTEDITDSHFRTEDNPGPLLTKVADNDYISYEFTAEQIVIDICNDDEEVAKKGPHTGTAWGVRPRRHHTPSP